eukprot:Unigene10194_Nuclearia_a/m.31131 Unigene10194_Nuclearia_a/g.31131  ORF Unigene10194_Nuclearia_a/g.31131 Unigene10194_Nuclearia_a/m.31131 type:complete len:143 (-) Unigene10194_Nuclearia_a:52-480(-)
MDTSPFPITTRQHVTVVRGVRTELLAQAYADHILLIVSQLGKVGSLIRASRNVDEHGRGTGTYSIHCLLGRRDDETLMVYAREIVERVASAQGEGNVRPLLLGLALAGGPTAADAPDAAQHDADAAAAFREITALVDAVRVW